LLGKQQRLGRKAKCPAAKASQLDRDEKQQQVQASRPCAQGFALRAQGSKPRRASLLALGAERKGLWAGLFALPVKLGGLPGQFAEAPIEQKASPRHSSG